MKIETGFAQVNGSQLYYETAGTGHPLVLLHGMALDTRMWDAQFEVFAQYYRVIRLDFRGFGRSPIKRGDTVHHFEDLHSLLTHLEIEQTHVIGLSLGGSIAIDFTLTHSAFVSKLVLVDSGCGGWEWSDEMKSIFAISQMARTENLLAAKKAWLECSLFQPAQEHAAVAKQLTQIVADYQGLHWLHDDITMEGPTPPAFERLNEIKAPTLIVVGERDVRDFHEIAAMIEREIPDAQSITLSDVGHMSNMEDSQGFNATVLKFLQDK
ncbi:MAG: alpha/beta hydrolase [Anaerolineales bacterium]|nr:alpha/beta hydrolase [Anaerolineales bacterium]MCB0019936.1 alpha/beta hydrolase [Anaerolineales bacterium]MCB0032164.1 alpha/beta hydrolase [Anaerolineales bacterium]